jgi:deoxyribodipyrimidine photo-lyase
MSRQRVVPARRALVLFTRDLRVRDQQALSCAAREYEQVIPAFVLDRELLGGSCGAPNRVAFLLQSLGDLDRSLKQRGARLLVRHGDVVEETMRLVHEYGLSAIHMSADVTPYARQRELRLARACEQARVDLRTHPGVTVVPAGAILPGGGDHYRVFTPYWRVWHELPSAPLAHAPRRITLPPRVRAGRLPKLADTTGGSCSPNLQAGGETAGRAQFDRWLARDASHHRELGDDLARTATSRLGAYLHFGCLSANAVLERSGGHPAGEAFARQLCWRDFHHQVLAARPELPRLDYRPRNDRWRSSARELNAWREGLTGYPIVDAGMRQLASEGFMHNRARLIVGSFLTKTLYLDWRAGAAHFATLLLDADVANNVGNWQWVAGTGNDTRPNRLLDPLRQAKRFDPLGDYVRRHLPELAAIGGGAVHEPWRLGAARQGLDYPERLVDHVAAAAAFRGRRARYSSSCPA